MSTKENQLIEIYDVWYRPWWHSKVASTTFVFVALALCLLLLYLLWKRFFASKSLSYDQVALLQLNKMKQESYSSQDALQDAYFTLTMILKTYLSKKYSISLLHKTDNEIVDYIKPVVSVDIFATLHEFFERSFQIKFAQAAVSEKMLQDDISFVERIVHATMGKQEDQVESS